MNTTTQKQSFAKNTSLYFSGSVVAAAIGFAALPFYTRYLSPSDYGIVALFIMFGQLTSGIFSLGLQSAAYRYYFKFSDKLDIYKSLNSTILIFNLLSFTPALFMFFYYGDWILLNLFDGELPSLLILLSFISGCMEYFIGYFLYLLTAQLRAYSYALIISIRSILRLIFATYFILLKSYTYMALINATVITQIIIFSSLIILNFNLLSLHFELNHLKKSLKFSIPMVLRLVISHVHKAFDKIMLTSFTGLNAVGFYSLSERIVSPLKIISDSIGNSWNPFFMQKANEKTMDSKKAIVNRFYEISFIIMFIGYGMICFSEEIIKLLTTEEFYPAMYLVPLYVFYHIVGILGYLSIPQIQFSEKTHYILPASIIGVVTNICLNILLIPLFGALGAVISLIAATVVSNLIHLYFGFKLFPIPTTIPTILMKLSIIIIFVLPVYPIMASQLNLFIKILIKIIMICSFFLFGIRFNYLSKNKIIKLISKFFSNFNVKFGN